MKCSQGAGTQLVWAPQNSLVIRNRWASVDSRRVKRRVLFEPLQLSPVIRNPQGQGSKGFAREGY